MILWSKCTGFITPVTAAAQWNHNVAFPAHIEDWILYLDQRGNFVLTLTPTRRM
uniref:Uncharacterized protein n=1 Tax=Arundo donax TaxID=35708 RepID=A0A0A9CQ59_ARUDO